MLMPDFRSINFIRESDVIPDFTAQEKQKIVIETMMPECLNVMLPYVLKETCADFAVRRVPTLGFG